MLGVVHALHTSRCLAGSHIVYTLGKSVSAVCCKKMYVVARLDCKCSLVKGCRLSLSHFTYYVFFRFMPMLLVRGYPGNCCCLDYGPCLFFKCLSFSVFFLFLNPALQVLGLSHLMLVWVCMKNPHLRKHWHSSRKFKTFSYFPTSFFSVQ